VERKIIKNLEAIEAMLYFWFALKDREKVREKFIFEVAEMPGLTLAYDEEFDGESVRRVLSAIKNREVFLARNKKEARFWDNNLWMLEEDVEDILKMIQPIKTLNLDQLSKSLRDVGKDKEFEELEVFFAPLHFDDYYIKDNKLIINFFNMITKENHAYIRGKEITRYIKDRLIELLHG
jgi:hypothetical protein